MTVIDRPFPQWNGLKASIWRRKARWLPALTALFGTGSSPKNTCSEEAEGDPPWMRDPLLHPQVAAMSLRALADLPFPRD